MTEARDAKHLETPEQALAFAKQLRNSAVDSLSRFHEFLWEVERRPALWNMVAPVFEGYLRHHHLGDWVRYHEWKNARAETPSAIQDAIGFHGVRHLSRVPEDRRKQAMDDMAATVIREGGVKLSDRRASGIAQRYQERQTTPSAEMLTRADLMRENTRLRKALARSEAKAARYKAALDKARGVGRGSVSASP